MLCITNEPNSVSFMYIVILYSCSDYAMISLKVLLELARNRNKIPLPKSIAGPGMALPPDSDTLISPNYQLVIPRKRTNEAIEETEEEEEGSDPKTNMSQEQRTDLPQNTPQRVSFPLGPKRAR